MYCIHNVFSMHIQTCKELMRQMNELEGFADVKNTVRTRMNKGLHTNIGHHNRINTGHLH